MNVAFLAIGNELLSGQTLDTNTQWAALDLARSGYTTTAKTTVSDKARAITEGLDYLLPQADILITSGGIGPTMDDITKKTITEYFGGTLVENSQILEGIKARFSNRGIRLNELTAGQAMVPDIAEAIDNPVGTAPVLWFSSEGKSVITLPGVPSEFRHLLKEVVLPRLLQKHPTEYISFREINTAAVPESLLAKRLESVEGGVAEAGISMAYLPTRGRVTIRLTAYGEKDSVNRNLDFWAAKTLELCGDDAYGTGGITLPQSVGNLLLDLDATLFTAESCTAGNLGVQITSAAGSSAYFLGGHITYSSALKTQYLGVSQKLIEKHTAVSEPVVQEMIRGALSTSGADYALATTGVAGPSPDEFGNPVGTVWIGWGKKDAWIEAKNFVFYKERETNIEMFTVMALDLFRRRLLAESRERR